MRAPDLVVGAKYIIKKAGASSAVYEGKHEGKITLADGSVFYGGNGALRFRYTDVATGKEVFALLDSGAEVEEAEATKLERERIFRERKAREDVAMNEAQGFIAALGFTVVERSYQAAREPQSVSLGYAKETADEIEVDGVTVGKLRAMIATVKPAIETAELA